MAGDDAWDGPIVDAHQHFWDPVANLHPWLQPGVMIPFRYGDYSAIKRRYLPQDYLADAGGHAVRETVYVETEWDPGAPIAETEYAMRLAEQQGLPSAIVAQAWLDRDDAAFVIPRQASFPLVRSVRHKPGGPATPDAVGRERTLMSDETWRRGYALLASTATIDRVAEAFETELDALLELAVEVPGRLEEVRAERLEVRRQERSRASWARAISAAA